MDLQTDMFVATHCQIERNYFSHYAAMVIHKKIALIEGTIIKMVVDLNKNKLRYYFDDKRVASIGNVKRKLMFPQYIYIISVPKSN